LLLWFLPNKVSRDLFRQLEVVRKDHFENQCVGTRGKAMADAELDAQPVGLIIDHREERLLLTVERLDVV
jgi:hypothetical protein